MGKLALALLSLGFSVGAVEWYLRPADGGEYHVWPSNLHRTFERSLESLGPAGSSTFSTNSFGVRGDAFAAEQQYHLLAIGGSTTICNYLDDSLAWPHQVQELLNDVLGAGYTWVGNVGRAGHRTAHHLLQVEKLLDQHREIDAVVMLIGINDLVVDLQVLLRPAARLTSFRRAKLEDAFSVYPGWDEGMRWYERTGIGLALRRVRLPARLGGTRSAEMDTKRVNVKLWRKNRREASVIIDTLPNLDVPIRRYAQRVGQLVEMSRQRGVRPILLTQPTLWRSDLSEEELDLLWMGGPGPLYGTSDQEYYSARALDEAMGRYNEVLLKSCAAREIECVDLAARLPKNRDIFWDDAHFTAEGSRQVAEILAKHLLERDPIARLARSRARSH